MPDQTETATPTSEPYTLGAFLACDHDESVLYEAVMEAHGPEVVERIVQRGLDAGQLVATPGLPGTCPIAFGVLDVLDADGDVIDDYVIPSYYAFDWWRKAIELRPTSSDCQVCEPEAFARSRRSVND